MLYKLRTEAFNSKGHRIPKFHIFGKYVAFFIFHLTISKRVPFKGIDLGYWR